MIMDKKSLLIYIAIVVLGVGLMVGVVLFLRMRNAPSVEPALVQSVPRASGSNVVLPPARPEKNLPPFTPLKDVKVVPPASDPSQVPPESVDRLDVSTVSSTIFTSP